MTRSRVREALAVAVFLGGTASALAQYQNSPAQGGTQPVINPYGTYLGGLQQPGQVGAANNPLSQFGRVGGRNTFTDTNASFGLGGASGLLPDRRAGYEANFSSALGGGRGAAALNRQSNVESTASALLGRPIGQFSNTYSNGLRLGGAYGSIAGEGGFGRRRGLPGYTPLSTFSTLRSAGSGFTFGRGSGTGSSGTAVPRGLAYPSQTLDRYQFLTPKSVLANESIPSRMTRAITEAARAPDAHGLDDMGPRVTPDKAAPVTEVERLNSTGTTSLAKRQQAKLADDERAARDQGDEYLRDGNVFAARSAYARCVSLNPDGPIPRLRLFAAAVVAVDPYRMGVHFRHALARVKTVDDLRINLSDTLPSLDKLKKFVRDFGPTAMKPKASLTSVLAYAYSAWLLGDTAVMDRALNKALDDFPSDGNAARLAKLLRSAGNGPGTGK